MSCPLCNQRKRRTGRLQYLGAASVLKFTLARSPGKRARGDQRERRRRDMATNLAAAVAFAAGLCVSAFAAASTVTMDFSGDVVITGNGGPADYSFSGSLTWDPASALVSSGCFEGGLSCYPASATFVFDST